MVRCPGGAGKASLAEQFPGKAAPGFTSVLALLGHNPFPGNPPRFVRLRLYRYDYMTREQRAASGRIWRRLPLYIY